MFVCIHRIGELKSSDFQDPRDEVRIRTSFAASQIWVLALPFHASMNLGKPLILFKLKYYHQEIGNNIYIIKFMCRLSVKILSAFGRMPRTHGEPSLNIAKLLKLLFSFLLLVVCCRCCQYYYQPRVCWRDLSAL